MTQITFHDGKIVMRDGKVGTEQECCCGCCSCVAWRRTYGECNALDPSCTVVKVQDDCYAYYTWEDWDCQNPLVGRDCGDGGAFGQCNIYARVKVVGNTPGVIEYLQSNDPVEVWGPDPPGGFCTCPDSFGNLSVQCVDCVAVCDCVFVYTRGRYLCVAGSIEEGDPTFNVETWGPTFLNFPPWSDYSNYWSYEDNSGTFGGPLTNYLIFFKMTCENGQYTVSALSVANDAIWNTSKSITYSGTVTLVNCCPSSVLLEEVSVVITDDFDSGNIPTPLVPSFLFSCGNPLP